MRNAYTVLVGKSEGNRSLERLRRRWDGSIRIDLRERVGGVGGINLAQDRDR
jgi:hypothetical protein